jgi:PPOX class probable F420-dependent enzyme
MIQLPASAVSLIESGSNAHLVTLNPDGSAQLSMIWAGFDNGEIICGHLRYHQKLRNVERDPRVVVSIEGPGQNRLGLRDYLVVHGTARVVEGGAPELLAVLAPRFLEPNASFPPENAPDGWVLRITPERIGGSGPWAGT